MIRIELEGEVERSFIFPSDIESAYAYFCDVDRFLAWLAHIRKTKEIGEGKYRLLFNSVELGIYSINIYCDMQPEFDFENKILKIVPFIGQLTIKPKATFYSLTAQGYFSSISVFHPMNGKTKIDYVLNIRARLPVPFAAKMLISASVIDMIAKSITYRRIHEIADTFIERSIQAYQA